MCPHFVLCQTDAKNEVMNILLSYLNSNFLTFQLKGSMPIKVFKIINKLLFTKATNETLRLRTSLLVTLKKKPNKTNPKNKTHQNQLKKPSISGLSHCTPNLSEKLKI